MYGNAASSTPPPTKKTPNSLKSLTGQAEQQNNVSNKLYYNLLTKTRKTEFTLL